MWLAKRTQSIRVPTTTMVRDPRAATVTGVGGTSPFRQGQYPNWNALSSVQDALYANIYVYACAHARATDLASLPIRVGADPEKPKDFDPQHPLAKLLGPAPGGPTMNISARRLIAWTLMQFDITGRFAWEIAPPVNHRNDGVPFEFWPMPAQLVTPVPTDGGGNWFGAYDYKTKNGLQRRLGLDQVLYHWRPKQEDFREPESLLEAARLNVSIAVMQDRYDYAFLVNDARPAAVVVHEEFQVKRERDGFRRQFLESHRGPDNAGKVAFVEASRDGALPKDSLIVQQLGLSQRDGEFINRMENEIRAICVAFGTPLTRLADSSRRTYANAEREILNYWRNGVKPAGIELMEGINIQIMPMLGDSSNVCWFDTTGVPELEPVRRFAVGDIPELLQSETITRNEARASIELGGIGPEGDILGTPAELAPSNAPPPDKPEYNPMADNTNPRHARNHLASTLRTRSAEDAAVTLIPGLVRLWNDSLRNLQGAQNAAILRRSEGKRGRQAARSEDLTSLHDRTYWYNQAFDRYTDLLRSTYLAASATLAATPGECRYAYDSPEAAAWVARHAGIGAARFVDNVQSVIRCSDPETLETMLRSSLFETDYEEVEHAYRSSLTTCRVGAVVVRADVAANAVLLLSRGEMDLESAMACLS